MGDLKGLVESLKRENEEKNKTIAQLQQRVEDLEQYTRQDDLIISGLKTQHKSYARATVTEAVTDNQNAPEDELGSLEAQVTTFIDKNMGISLMDADVSTCHTLPGKKDTPNIVIRLANRKVKNKVLRQAKQ